MPGNATTTRRKLEAILQKGHKAELLQLVRSDQAKGDVINMFWESPREVVRLPGMGGRKHINTRLPNTMEYESCKRQMIDFIENWQPEERQRPEKPVPPGIEDMSQDAWLHPRRFEDFKGIMLQLSISPNRFVDKKTYEEAELIYEGHFSNPKLKTDQKHMINWKGTGAACRVFFDLLVETQRIEEQFYSHFIFAHFSKKGKRFQAPKKVNDWCVDSRKNRDQPSEDEKKLRKIVS